MLRNQSGMTLIEIMIVIVILGGLMTVLGKNVMDQSEKAKYNQAKIQMKQIMTALEAYYTDCGTLPDNEVGLYALVEEESTRCENWGPRSYIKSEMLKSPWKHEFLYDKQGEAVIVTFLGKDGQEGGDDYNKDIEMEL